ncbi:MAG: hypothetical protein M1818_003769 [Claussenomyces sp. TS43310]|nr:MAG: hypothetical protein M1818_003769 [Claussenomyces sp. TS43310]
MVLFKRKPVQYLTPPIIEDDDTEVWLIPQTEEIFADYEAYLNRMDFYKQSRFICQITGHSGLTFFEALKSELAGAREVEEAFPEALKGPVLRRVQFQTISRIDNLVDMIFDEFKADYYPGEAVTVHVVTGERLVGVVRDKTRFGNKLLPNGTLSEAFSRYFVSLDNRPLEEAVVDDNHITRDRKLFTKQVLRSFIKKTVTREAWTGAPWLVKHDVAALYHIDTRVPPNLRHENKIAVKKEQQLQKKNGNVHNADYEAMVGSFPGNGQRLPELKPAPKSHKSKQHQGQTKGSKLQFLHPPPPNISPTQYVQPPPFPTHPFPSSGIPHGAPPPQYSNFHNSTYTFAPLQAMPALPPPPPPIKYPIEDLQIAPRKDAAPRPPLKFYSEDTPVSTENNPARGSGILMESVGSLLETWTTLNVYCEIYQLDSFTFDDFVEAMQFASEDVECELFVEIHCAALKVLVDPEVDDGKVQVQLPEMDNDSEEERSEDEDSAARTVTPEPPPKPKGRTTRSSLAKAEAAEIKAEPVREPSPEFKKTHLAAEMQAEYDWVERLRKRDFKSGGWEVIMVGLLHQLSKDPRYEKTCEELLQKLAPVDQEPTAETTRQQYASLDINLRVKALQVICMLTIETKAIRGFMEEGAEVMTKYRKEKIQWQRDRKAALEELRLLNEERKILQPVIKVPSPEPSQKHNGDVKMNGVEAVIAEEVEEEVVDTDEDAHQGRSLRRGNDRAAQRQRKREEEQERKEKAEAAAKIPKPSKQLTKILKDIQKKQDYVKKCEDEIVTLDNDLREADCPRTRVLGKDRFWNRYYWFERNSMPYAGLPDSSTAHAGYANGCIWVQGPDDMEREGYIDMKEEWQKEYKAQFDMTVPERKMLDEGQTHVFNARQWGYYDDPADVDKLIEWLDQRGFNELKLQKEMKSYRDKIVAHMDARKEYLHPSEEKIEDLPGKRMSTRTKHHADHSAHRCLSWHNTTALHLNGHLHYDQPRARKPAASRKKAVEVVEERETRSETKKKEKGAGRR